METVRRIQSIVKLDTPIMLVALGMVAYQLFISFYLVGTPEQIQNYHLAFAFILVFLVGIRKSKKFWWLKLLLVVLSLVATGYIQAFYHDLELRMGFPVGADILIGALLILLCLEGTRQAFGLILPVIVIFYLAYAFLGYHLPEPFHTMQFPPERLLSKLTILQGIYGVVLGISAKYVFLFILFGAALQVSGAIGFFTQVGRLVGSRMRGGAGMTCVIASGLMGMVSGSVTGNIVTTGSFTIPLMKRAGYKPHQAAAIEATASTGGQIMPPIMGAVAFIMAAFTGIPYIKIIAAAALPAILYFFSVGLYTQFQAAKLGISPLREKVDTREMLLTAHLFIVPLLALIILMAMGFSPMLAVSRSLLLLIALSLIRKKTRPALTEWVQGLTRGAILGARIGVLLALVGIIISISSLTGLGIKLPAAIEGWSGGYLAAALAITVVVALILGAGLDIGAVYVLVAIMAAPVLVKLGLGVLQAHLFAFYYAVMSFVTPPVAIAALVASPLAGAKFLKTAVEATKAAAAGFVIPFLFILSPILLLQPQAPLPAVTGLLSAIIILITLQVVICGYYLTTISLPERALAAAVDVMLLVSLAMTSYILFAAGVGGFILLTLRQLRKRRLSALESSKLVGA